MNMTEKVSYICRPVAAWIVRIADVEPSARIVQATKKIVKVRARVRRLRSVVMSVRAQSSCVTTEKTSDSKNTRFVMKAYRSQHESENFIERA